MRAARDARSMSSTWSRWRRSTVTAPRYVSPTSHSTPPTTDEPPPYGIAAAPTPAHQSRTSATSASVRELAAERVHDVSERLAVGVPGPLGGLRRALRRKRGRGIEPGLGEVELVDRGRVGDGELAEVEHTGEGL